MDVYKLRRLEPREAAEGKAVFLKLDAVLHRSLMLEALGSGFIVLNALNAGSGTDGSLMILASGKCALEDSRVRESMASGAELYVFDSR